MPLPVPLILAAIKLIPKLRKSKTAKVNVGVGAVITILSQFGIDASPELISAIFVVANFIMRTVTNRSLGDK